MYYIRQGYAEDYSDAGINFDLAPNPFKDMKALVRNTCDWQIVDEQIVDKYRTTAFFKTDLLDRIQRDRVGHLVVCGIGTNVCVESTVRDAITHEVFAVTVSDATATSTVEEHEASLKNLGWFGGVATVKEIEEALEAPAAT